MSHHNQKKLIAALLLISCLFSAWLLFVTPASGSKQLQSFAQADSLLQLTLSDFNISQRQQSSSAVQIDSNFTRKTYQIDVPPSFSKTQFHAVLQNRLSSYGVSLPASVTFPEQDMNIHLISQNTIFQTIKLATDEDLKLKRSFASLIVAFENRPPDALLNKLKSLGEPIPVAIKMISPLEQPDWWNIVSNQYSAPIIWPVAANGGNILTDDQEQMISSITPLEESFSGATLLSFLNDDEKRSIARNQTSFSFIPVNNATIFTDQMNEAEFSQTFRTFVERTRSGSKPIGIIMGTTQTLEWTQHQLNTFKKGGLFIVPPNKL